jgi:hypothetical protein
MNPYLKNKGITPAIIDKFKISWNDETLFLPVFDRLNNKLYTKYKRNDQQLMNPSGANIALYGQQFLDQSKNVVITEGESDCLALHTIGVLAVTSTTGVMSFKEE